MVVQRTEGGRVDGPLGGVGLHPVHRVRVEQHTGVVLAGRDEHAAVLAGLHVHDGLAVVRLQLQLLLGLDVPLDQVSVVVACQQQFIQTSPQHGGHLGSIGRNGHLEDGVLCIKGPGINDVDLTRVTHLLVCGVTHHISTKTEVCCSYSALGVDLVQLLARLDVPEPDGVVRGARHEVGGVPLGVQTPDSSTVAIVGAQPLTIEAEPDIGMMILGAAEQEVSLPVVLDLSDRPLMAVHHDGLHDEILQNVISGKQ